MKWLPFLVVSIALISSGSVKAQEGEANDAGVSLSERVKVLEERLDKLDKVEVIKQVVEYICHGGEIYDSLPPGGRCPNGSLPEERITFGFDLQWLFSSTDQLTGEKNENIIVPGIRTIINF